MSLRLRNLKKDYTAPDGSVVPVIDVADLALADAEHVALIGSSGSGKTTLLHLIAGIVAPDAGQIIHDTGPLATAAATTPASPSAIIDYRSAATTAGRDIATFTEPERDVFRGRHIGYIFQTHHLLGGFTALENVLLGMSFTGRHPDRPWAVKLLEEVGLANRLDYRPDKLSVGQQQRVAVARALANRPRLVLADEPTGALDPANAQQVLALIRKLCTEVGAALLLVTHDLEIAHQFPRVLNLADINTAHKQPATAQV